MTPSPSPADRMIDPVVLRELVDVAEVDTGSLASELDWVDQLQAIDRLTAWAQAQAYRVMAQVAPPDTYTRKAYLQEQHLIEEIQVARRRGQWAAHTAIDTARALSTVFGQMFHALEEGQTSDSHVRSLVSLTAAICDDPKPPAPAPGETPVDVVEAAGADCDGADCDAEGETPEAPPVVVWRSRETKLRDIQMRVLDRARSETVGAFRRSVTAAICAVDALGEADRRAKAKKGRTVSHRSDADGMGQIYARDEETRTQAMLAELTRRAKALQTERGGATAARDSADATLAACRADALAAAILGTVPTAPGADSAAEESDAQESDAGAGQPSADSDSETGLTPGTPSTCAACSAPAGGSGEPRGLVIDAHLVIDLATLRREQDNPCTLDGVPITAAMGRDLAATAVAWRRMVTAPVTGHLLDYGDRTYLPAALVKFIAARDGQCTAPYCERPARRCQMDHRVPFPDGPSSAANCGELCDRHHPLKTAGYVSITHGKADGSMTWNTLHGQKVHAPPRAFLDNPQPEQQHPDDTTTETDTSPSGPEPPTDTGWDSEKPPF